MASWCKTSTPRSKRSKRFSRRCSTSRGSTAAPCGRNFPNLPSTICCSGSPSSSRRSPAARASTSGYSPAARQSARTPPRPARSGGGLGLSIVERIARVLDCEVVLQSVLDRGSRFSVEVPRAAAAVIRPDAARALRPDAGSLAGTVVLCIDNERAILDGMQRLLGGWGCRVLTAADLPEALAALEASEVEPDGLLVDYHLDGGDGIDTITELRRRAGRHIPAIVITADRSAHIRDQAQTEGAHVLNKPVKPASLRALIAQWQVRRVAAE